MAGSGKSDLAKTLIALRRQMGLTQEQVAKAVQIKRSTYAYYERSTNPPLKILNKLASVFNVSLDTLTGRFSPYKQVPTSFNPENAVQNFPPDGYRYEKIYVAGELSKDEQELLLNYRLLPQKLKETIKITIKDYVNKIDE